MRRLNRRGSDAYSRVAENLFTPIERLNFAIRTAVTCLFCFLDAIPQLLTEKQNTS